MARKKKLLVEDLLNIIDKDTPTGVSLFAYGIKVADTPNDGMETAADHLEELCFDCRRAQVGRITVMDGRLWLGAEIIHN